MTVHVRPVRVVLFDVNETLSNLAPLAQRFEDVGLPATAVGAWFAGILRDGFALTSLGQLASFQQLAQDGVRSLLAREAGSLMNAQESRQPDRGPDDVVADVMRSFLELPLHSDVPDGVRGLREARLRLATLSNGPCEVAESLLTRAGIRQEFEAVLSADQAGVWKPAAQAYRYAARKLKVAPDEMLMVAVHPWDLHGAALAGMRTAWVNRRSQPYPATFIPPELVVPNLVTLAQVLRDGSADAAWQQGARHVEALTEALWGHLDYLEREAILNPRADIEGARSLADRLLEVLAHWDRLSEQQRALAEQTVAYLLDEDDEKIDLRGTVVRLEDEDRVNALEQMVRNLI